MPNTLRWRYGDTNPVLIPVEADTLIEIGDLLYFDTDNVKPASAQSDQGSLGANQQMFHDAFAGVAMQASPDGEDRAIRVATTGVFEFDCASATIEVGQLIGATENGSGDALLDQSVISVSGVGNAIGRCAKRVNPAGTRVLVDIVSSILKGGPQAVA